MLGLTRKLLYSKPKKADPSLLAQFYYADVDLCNVASELDSFDGRKNPAKCATLVAQLRQYQDQVLKLMQLMMEEVICEQRASRDFRVKYPEDLIQDGLAGQLWFGAECLAAGSSILNREVESESMRPIAKSLTKQLDLLRQVLRDQSTRDPLHYTDKIKSLFIKFDRTFAEFELSYVSAMVPVKTMKEYDMSQEVTALFSETVHRALAHGLITRDMLEYYDPVLMFTIPRLAIVSGLVIFPEGPLNPQRKSANMSEMFRPFQSLLKRIRELLWTLSQDELRYLERLLCNLEEASNVANDTQPEPSVTHNARTKSNEGDNSAPSKSTESMQLTPTTAAATSSLFNDISNLDDPETSARPARDAGEDFRTSLMDVLSVEPVSTERAQSDSDSANNNTPDQYTDPLGAQTLPAAEDNSNSVASTSSVIINDYVSGVARVIIGDSSVPQAVNDSATAILDVQQSSNVVGATRTSSSSSSRTRYRRQHSASSTAAPSAQFAFNLPEASHDAVNGGENSGMTDAINGGGEPVAVEDCTVNRLTEPSRVTVTRLLSDGATGEPTRPRENNSDTDSTSDSSMSSASTSDSESSSSSSSSASNRRLIAKSALKAKSESLRRQYKNTEELIQKLFICVSGVADQLQSNFACDLRNILKCVFDLHMDDEPVTSSDKCRSPTIATVQQSPPTWIPDAEMDKCCSCKMPFTLIRRRHHCRNCGLIFCGRCSSNSAPLPNYGYTQAVRICNKCYVYRINPFFMDNNEESYNSTTSRHPL